MQISILMRYALNCYNYPANTSTVFELYFNSVSLCHTFYIFVWGALVKHIHLFFTATMSQCVTTEMNNLD